MRLILGVALASAMFVGAGAEARDSTGYIHHARSYQGGETDLIRHSGYKNSYGHEVHSPSRTFSGLAPSGASAHCRDGSYSFSEHHQGTCSHHGGVSNWMR